MGVQSYVHASVDSPTFKEGSAVMFGHVLDGVNEDLQKVGETHLPIATLFLDFP